MSDKQPQHPLEKLVRERIVVIDGAMGTTIRTYGMKEADIRGDRWKSSKKDLLNNGDLFSLTQPDMIMDIHRRFLEAGADIIETNTFGATSITQSEFFVTIRASTAGARTPSSTRRSSMIRSSTRSRGRSTRPPRDSAEPSRIAPRRPTESRGSLQAR